VPGTNDFGKGFDGLFAARIKDADEFYASRIPDELSADARNVMRQSYAGMLWSKQFITTTLQRGLEAIPAPCAAADGEKAATRIDPPLQRRHHLHAISGYPWYAAWDLAFHCITLALVDPDFAKEQLILLLREWYMHPNGQLLRT